jgi:ATP-grasp domain-containing protein
VINVWFNRTFSSIHAALMLLRRDDAAGEIRLICSHPNPHFLGFLVAHEGVIEHSDLSGEAYIDYCLEFVKTQGIDIFVPGKEAALITANTEHFAALGTRVLTVADPATLALLQDKGRFYQQVDHAIAAPPDFICINDSSGFRRAYAELRSRYAVLCIKPAISIYAQGFKVIDEQHSALDLLLEGAQYRITLPQLERCLAEVERFKDMLVMEYLGGHELSIDCVGDQGRLIYAIARKKPLVAGQGQLIDDDPEIQRIARQLARAYGLNGIYNIQLKEDAEGKLRLLEINPRISGGIAMSCLSGINLLYVAIRGFVHGFARIERITPRTGVRVGEAWEAVELP